MKIVILGSGNAKCEELGDNAEAAARSLGLAYEIERVTDISEIQKFRLRRVPALVVNGKVVHSGTAATPAEIALLLV